MVIEAIIAITATPPSTPPMMGPNLPVLLLLEFCKVTAVFEDVDTVLINAAQQSSVATRPGQNLKASSAERKPASRKYLKVCMF